MKGYWKLTAALAAFVMLFIAVGVSTQGTAFADAGVTLTVTPTSGSTLTSDGKLNDTICSNSGIAGSACLAADGTFTITVHNSAAATQALVIETITVSVKNVDLATVTPPTGVDSNPKTITLVETGVDTHIFSRLVRSKHASTGLTADVTNKPTPLADDVGTVEVKAFTGNTLTATYNPVGSLGITKSIKVDNVKPTLLTSSPTSNLIIKGNTTVVFTADVTDSEADFPTKASNVNANNTAGTKGRVQLFVGTSAVTLPDSAYTAITDGWRVSASFNSNDIANIAAKVPWWIQAEDLAGNVQEPSSGTTGTTTSLGATPVSGVTASTVIDSAFATLPDDLFNGRQMKITIAGVDQTETIVDFTGASGTFIFGTAAADSFTVAIASGTTYEITKTLLITVDSTAPTVAAAADVTTGEAWDATKAAGTRLRTGLNAKNTSIRVKFTDTSGLDISTVTPVSFTVTGNTVNSVLLVDVVGQDAAAPEQRIPNDVFLTLANSLSSSGRPDVSISSGLIKDKAGNGVTGVTFKATDKLGPGLLLDTNASLNKKEIKTTITSDEQLGANPVVALSTLTSNTAGTLAAAATPGSLSQTTALTYSYSTKIASIPADTPGAEFNVYVTGSDTSANPGKAGHASDGTNSSAKTFELDQMLNGGKEPKVSVSDKVATVTTVTAADGPKVEAVNPMIVTVDFNQRCLLVGCTTTSGTDFDAKGESAEYARDSFKTVSLTKASLKVTFTDGSFETTPFDLATQVSSPDSKRFTIPVLSPKVGKYVLTINAVDLAGNDNLSAPTAVTPQDLKFSWEVTAAKPVKLALSPGWNLISLPFQPANPAINSVIATNHPADIVMTFDNANQVWLVSRRDATSGLFTGDVTVMTANTAYFLRTNNFQELEILRPPVATAAAAPPPPPAIAVVPGWNLVPVVSLSIPLPTGVAANSYFGTLQSGANVGWLKAMTFDPLSRTWTSVTPNDTFVLAVGATNPCTGIALVAANVATITEPCQNAAHVDTSAGSGFNLLDTVAMKRAVLVGKGYWLYASNPGVIIP